MGVRLQIATLIFMMVQAIVFGIGVSSRQNGTQLYNFELRNNLPAGQHVIAQSVGPS